jgi:hypothetical protein
MATKFSDMVTFVIVGLTEPSNHTETLENPIKTSRAVEVVEGKDGDYRIETEWTYNNPYTRKNTSVEEGFGLEIRLSAPMSVHSKKEMRMVRIINDVCISVEALLELREQLSGNSKREVVYHRPVYPCNSVNKSTRDCELIVTFISIDDKMYIRRIAVTIPKDLGDTIYRIFAKYDRQTNLTAVLCQ